MKKIVTLVGVSIFALSVTAFPAYAKVAAVLDSGVQIKGGIEGAVDTTVDTNVNVGIHGDGGIDIEANATSSHADVSNSAEGNTAVSLKVNASGVAITSASKVNSEEDLKVFSSNISSQNKAIVLVNVSSENTAMTKVQVVYRHKGKFLGFIPVTIKSTTVVEARENSEAEIKSSLSWWSFLVAGENYSKTNLESRIKGNSKVLANAKANASAQARAEIAEAVIAELQANASVK